MRNWILGLTIALWTSLAVAATPQTVVLEVKNMTCPACSITIEKALAKVHGVSGQRIDTEAGMVTVTFDSERTSVPKVVDAITNAGFPAKAKASDG